MDFEADGNFSYIIRAEVTNTENIPNGMVCKKIPAAKYAVLPLMFFLHFRLFPILQQ
jgi:predicted transcriptional regulator YdeE